MSKLSRIFQKQFGVNAGASDVGIFGSLAASDPQYSKDPTEIQSLNAFLTGWAAETIANNRPALEDFNALDFLTFYQLCYLFQSGVPEWDDETTYYTGSIVQDGNGVLYRSLDDDNVNNELTDTDYWAPVFTETAGGVQGSHKNLKASRTSASQITVTADELVLEDADGEKVTVRNFNKTAAITTSGAGGLDDGSETNGWYYAFAIRKSSDGTTALLLSASSSSPTMPAGYDQKCYVSQVYNKSGDFVSYTQYGDKCYYDTWQDPASGNVGINPWVSIDISAFVPSDVSNIAFGSFGVNSGQSAGLVGLSNINPGAQVHSDASQQLVKGAGVDLQLPWELNVLTAGTLYWGSNSAYAFVKIAGFKINKL